jgi:hypothetical protein
VALVDTESLIVEQAVAFSLPDPTLVAGRTHDLKNAAAGNIVVSSTGATPFSTGGVTTATITMTPGQSIRYQSDGIRWTAKSSGGRTFFAANGVTDGAGNVVFNFPAGLFAVAPVVGVAFQGAASASPVDYRITAVSAASVTINVRQSLATVVALIGLTILAASVPLAGATIHLIATPSGATP